MKSTSEPPSCAPSTRCLVTGHEPSDLKIVALKLIEAVQLQLEYKISQKA